MGKHTLGKDMEFDTKVTGYMAACEFALLLPSGKITLLMGFTWDGADVIPDSRINLLPSAVHDALYSMISNGSLPKKERKNADKTYVKMCEERGQNLLLNKASYLALRLFGRFHL